MTDLVAEFKQQLAKDLAAYKRYQETNFFTMFNKPLPKMTGQDYAALKDLTIDVKTNKELMELLFNNYLSTTKNCWGIKVNDENPYIATFLRENMVALLELTPTQEADLLTHFRKKEGNESKRLARKFPQVDSEQLIRRSMYNALFEASDPLKVVNSILNPILADNKMPYKI